MIKFIRPIINSVSAQDVALECGFRALTWAFTGWLVLCCPGIRTLHECMQRVAPENNSSKVINAPDLIWEGEGEGRASP